MDKIIYSAAISPGDVVAIGDVHARFDLLEPMVDWLRSSGARVILCGDLIDRGGQDVAVLDLVKSMVDDPDQFGLESVSVIKGNHELMFVDAATKDESRFFVQWLQNGGNFDQFDEMIDSHLDWLKELPSYIRIADTLFVHAGLVPGQNPEVTMARSPDTLQWIRDPFLMFGPGLENWTAEVKRVVHGHSIESKKPVVKGQRINIDTGSFVSGVLTAFNATQNTFHQIKGKPDKRYGTVPN